MRRLVFTRQADDEYDVMEIGDPWPAYAGRLVLVAGRWRFKSSDDSIDWALSESFETSANVLKRRYKARGVRGPTAGTRRVRRPAAR